MLVMMRYALVVLSFLFAFNAQAQYTNIYVLGDSLSDNGNLKTTGLAPFLNAGPYDDGRFTNGPVAVELLASNLGLDLEPSLHLIGPVTGTNFAVAGATAAGTTAIDLPTQLGALLLSRPTGFTAEDLIVVFIGGNDIRNTRESANRNAYGALARAALAVESSVQDLINAGASKIMLINSADIGAIPETTLLSGGNRRTMARLTLRTRIYNFFLKRASRRLNRANETVQLVNYDLFNVMKSILKSSDELGYNNDEEACFIQRETGQVFNPGCDFDAFLFFDAIHPTAITHARAASAIQAFIPSPN